MSKKLNINSKWLDKKGCKCVLLNVKDIYIGNLKIEVVLYSMWLSDTHTKAQHTATSNRFIKTLEHFVDEFTEILNDK